MQDEYDDAVPTPGPDEHDLAMRRADYLDAEFLWAVTVASRDKKNRVRVAKLVKSHVEQLLDELLFWQEEEQDEQVRVDVDAGGEQQRGCGNYHSDGLKPFRTPRT